MAAEGAVINKLQVNRGRTRTITRVKFFRIWCYVKYTAEDKECYYTQCDKRVLNTSVKSLTDGPKEAINKPHAFK